MKRIVETRDYGLVAHLNQPSFYVQIAMGMLAASALVWLLFKWPILTMSAIGTIVVLYFTIKFCINMLGNLLDKSDIPVEDVFPKTAATCKTWSPDSEMTLEDQRLDAEENYPGITQQEEEVSKGLSGWIMTSALIIVLTVFAIASGLYVSLKYPGSTIWVAIVDLPIIGALSFAIWKFVLLR